MTVTTFLFFLSGLGIFQGLLISLLVIYRARKSDRQNQLPGLLFFLAAVVMLLITLVNSGLLSDGPTLQMIENTITLVVGPLTYFYLRPRIFSEAVTRHRYGGLPFVGYLLPI